MRRRRPLLLLAAAAVVAGAALGSGPGAPSAAEEGAVAGTPLVEEALGRVSPALLGTAVDGPAYSAAVAALRDAERGLERARATAAEAAARRDRLVAEERALAEQLARASAEEQAAAEALDAARRRLAEVAVAAYVTGASTAQVSALLDAGSVTELHRRSHLLEVVRDDQQAVAATFTAARDRASDEVARTVAALDTARRSRERAAAAVEVATATSVRLRDELPGRRAATAAAAPGSRVAGTDLSIVALDAYWRAAGSVAGSCGIPWTAVAGVGRIESFHGTYGGRRPAASGDISPPIIGIPLDGTRATRRILDTDGGALDGDAVLDRAVGPTQFLPSTWATFGTDGNGDGVADPQNIYDAARSTARYLCHRSTGAMRSDDLLRAAFFRYNRSEAYAASVLGWTRRYDAVQVGGG